MILYKLTKLCYLEVDKDESNHKSLIGLVPNNINFDNMYHMPKYTHIF